ncbi:efflux RND transporter periplasmic adaptor subunit [Roseateles amylovorans]|uniref:Efflux RND transporter periplasmic adaptor subunit n=1 Tax=Roseateles amylovorans TaxID=2978473 RepID=A0ABY6AWY5_9BURK|nr:efflux RND transporter periplasmic adaptor subunit [Roseateles amylovorans]UXH77392.1 efflux RND transporter periplasmic adaptor subunit [Roseateles amylovorans]
MNKYAEQNNRPRLGLGKRQLIAIAVILLMGGAAAIGILSMGASSSGSEDAHGHGHEEAKGHDDAEHHGDEKATSKNSAKTSANPKDDGHGHSDAKSHADAEHHEPAAKAQGHGGDRAQDKDGHGKPEATGQAKGEAQDAHEEVIPLTDAQLKTAGVTLDVAKAAVIRSGFRLPGEIRFNEDRTAHIVPRVSGVVESVPVTLGQVVRKGQVLAVLSSSSVSDQRAELQAAQKRMQLARTTYEREKRLWEEKISPQQDVQQAEQALRETEIAVANARQKLQAVGASAESGTLNRFEIRAPFEGTLVEKHIGLGEQVREDASVFTLSDLRTVWAQINVPAKDLATVRVGESVTVRSTAFEQSAAGKIAYVGALIGEQTRTAQARVTLDNPQAAWRPGLFVDVEVMTAQANAVVTVTADAVQTMADKTVVFVKAAGGFLPQPVRTGRADGQRVEILDGLKPGTTYVAAGSFVVKAQAGKAAATHSH